MQTTEQQPHTKTPGEVIPISQKKRMIIVGGKPGTGKTTALKTLIGDSTFIKDVFVIATDPSSQQVIDKFPPDVRKHFHMAIVAPTHIEPSDLSTLARQLDSQSGDGRRRIFAAQSKASNMPRKTRSSSLVKICDLLSDFRTERFDAKGQPALDGEGKPLYDEWGPVNQFNHHSVIVVDSFTTLSTACMHSILPNPAFVPELGDYGVAASMLYNIINTLIQTPAHLIVTAHATESGGGRRGLVSSAGSGIWEKVNGLASDTIESYSREGTTRNFSWRVGTALLEGVKTRTVPEFAEIPQNYEVFFRKQ